MRNTAMALVAPLVIFGVFYVLVVEPQRAAASAAERQLAETRAAISRERSVVRSSPRVTQTSEERVGNLAESLRALLNSPTVGDVVGLSIETGAATTEVPSTVTASFDARYDEIGRFFWNLRTLPAAFDLRSFALTPGRGPLVHADVVLFAQRKMPASDQVTPGLPMQAALTPAPEWKHNPFAAASQPKRSTAPARRKPALPAQPDPVVTSILRSVGRRVALIDGRIFKEGDRIGSSVVRTIEPDSVVIATPDGEERRLLLKRPGRR